MGLEEPNTQLKVLEKEQKVPFQSRTDYLTENVGLELKFHNK